MEAFFSFLKVMAICVTALVALFLVLLAMLRSPFREFTLNLTKRVGATAVGAGAFLPMDVVPVVGEIGRRTALRWLRPQGHGGSSPPFRTIDPQTSSRDR